MWGRKDVGEQQELANSRSWELKLRTPVVPASGTLRATRTETARCRADPNLLSQPSSEPVRNPRLHGLKRMETDLSLTTTPSFKRTKRQKLAQ